MISAFAIFRLVVDRRTFYLNFSCREIALEVFHVSGCIPQAPFCKREYLERFHFFGIIFERHLLHLSPSVERNEEEYTCLHTIFTTRDTGIIHTMAALVAVEWGFTRFPTRIPDGIAFLDVEVTSAIIHRNPIVAITGDATELGILIERITTGCIGDEREEILVAQIVDPRPWSLWICNHVLAIGVIKMTILFLCHCLFSIYIVIYSCFEMLIPYSNYLILYYIMNV